MTLLSGTRLGPYEIVAPLGAGGMGEVYRAKDTRLGRDVAVKVLPTEVANDVERLRRFELEARAASALNHPNLLVLFDVGRVDETSYLVTELLEGRSLRDVLTSGEPIAARRALDWSAQIARGLAAAHEKGIVHRDLKPENIFVTSSGSVKILDFGLAKLTRPESAADLAAGTTIAGATETGVIMGTAGYMAPEQVRGERVDARADLFSLGCVLYEILSGRSAFGRPTAADTLSAILRDDPAPLEAATSGATIPLELRHLVERCLAKAPSDRWQSARDLAFRIEELAQAGSGPAMRTLAGALTLSPRARSWRRFLPWAIAAVALIAAGVLYRSSAQRAAGPPPLWQRVTFRRGVPTHGRFGPDGKTILYGEFVNGGERRLFSTRLDSPESTELALPSARIFAVAPNGQLALGLGSGDSRTLALASLAGGGARELLQDVESADFAPDGSRLAAVHTLEDRDVVELPVGTVLFDPGPGVRLADLRFSPAGDRLALVEKPTLTGPYDMTVIAVDLQGKRTVVSDGWPYIQGLAWNPGSGEVWFTAQASGKAGGMALQAATLDGHARLVQTVPGLVRLQDVLADGRVLLLHSLWPCTMVCRAPGDAHERDLSWLDYSVARDLSDDGKSILFTEDGIAWGGNGAVYLRSMDGGGAVRLGEGEAHTLSRDGKWAVAQTVGRTGGFVLLPTGAGSPRSITVADGGVLYARLFPDGRELLLRTERQGEGRRLYRRPLSGGDGDLRVVSPSDLRIGPIAPDGRSAAVLGPNGWQLLALDGSGALTALPGITQDDVPLRFDTSGGSLFVARGSVPTEVRSVELSSGKATTLLHLGPEFTDGVSDLAGLAISADGRSYCYSYVRDTSDLYVVSGLN